MNTPPLDMVILGQGLAGTTLAWVAHWAGLRVAIIDRNEAVTSSKIAAGLMTPITGKRLTTSPQWNEYWEVARTVYQHVEHLTRRKFFRPTAMVRTLNSQEDADTFAARMQAANFSSHVRSPPQPELDPAAFFPRLGHFEMLEGGQLHVAEYLAASREFFQQERVYFTADVDPANDLVLREDGVALPQCNLYAARLVFCQGYAGASNAWFDSLPFNPAKGEILTVRIPGLKEERVLHGGLWIAPMGQELFRVGATYDWSRFDHVPTQEGRHEIETRLRDWLRLPFTVEEHHAAVRPILKTLRPYWGFHPQLPQLGVLNGLASKGALLAPYYARELIRSLTVGGILDSTMELRRQERLCRTVPLTEIAHREVHACKTDIVIDATAGNGHDTLFLAQSVGPYGKVYAFDIQQAALDQTASRLAAAGMTNVRLIHDDHAKMSNRIDPQDRGRIAVVMFNLGYLPRGDKSIITKTSSTLAAIKAAIPLLRFGGTITILAYPGHPGGREEMVAVEYMLADITPALQVRWYTGDEGTRISPRLLVLTKR